MLRLLASYDAALPHFEDGRINYRGAESAPVLQAFVLAEGELLLLRRSEKMSYGGKWHGVAGFLDEVRPLQEKVFEELREELGVLPEHVAGMRAGDPAREQDQILLIVHPVLVEMRRKVPITLDWEHSEHRWIRPEDITAFDTVPNDDKMLARALAGTPLALD